MEIEENKLIQNLKDAGRPSRQIDPFMDCYQVPVHIRTKRNLIGSKEQSAGKNP